MKKILLLIFCIFIISGCTNKGPNDDIIENITITFDGNGGSNVDNITIKKDSSTPLPTPTNDGYIFVGWLDKDGNTYTSESIFSKDITLIAKWTIDNTNITITFDEKGGSPVLDITTTKNTLIDLPIPSKTGFSFVCWTDEVGTTYPLESKFTKDTNLFAKWELAKFQVKFLDFDGNVLSVESVFYNQSATAPVAPSRLNFVFNKWDTDYSKVTTNLEIKPIYEESTEGLIFELTDYGYMVTDYVGNSSEVVMPNYMNNISVNEIGSNAFEYSTITNIRFSNNLIKINDYAFNGAASLTSLNFPVSLIEIGSRAFADCTSLTSLTIPAQIIGDSAFHGSANITDIVLLDTVKTIKAYAFYNNSDLINLTIPSSVTTIEAHIFSWCQKLTNVFTENANVTRLQEMLNTSGYIYAKNAKVVGK